MSPYSMPLCTIFTKCPAPTGPQCRYPASAVERPSAPSRPGVRGAASTPGASAAKIGSRWRDDLGLAADHHAEAALEPEHPAARADVDVVHALGRERLRPLDVVAVVGVAAVDHDVARVHETGELLGGLSREGGRHHDPCGARRLQRADQVLERRRARGALALEHRDRVGVDVVDDDLVPGPHQPAREVRAHATEPHHAELHRTFPLNSRWACAHPVILADGEGTDRLT